MTVTAGLVQMQQTDKMIGYCNITNTNACLVQVYQTCMVVGASLTDMAAG